MMFCSNRCPACLSAVSPKITLIGRPSIYPCSDSFYSVLVSNVGSSSQEDEEDRLVRFFHSNVSKVNDVTTLRYVREFDLPSNNLLRLDCSTHESVFDLNEVFHCFQFVVKDRRQQRIKQMSQVFCIPTFISSEGEHSNNIDTDSLAIRDVKGLFGHLFPHSSSSKTAWMKSQGDNFGSSIKSVAQECPCFHSETTIATQQEPMILQLNAKQEAVIALPTTGKSCNTRHTKYLNDSSPEFSVCLLDSSTVEVPKGRAKVLKIHSISSQIIDYYPKLVRIRDGRHSVDPILPLDFYQELHSDFIRIEFPIENKEKHENNTIVVVLSFETRNESKSGHSFLKTLDESRSLQEMLYYGFAYGSLVAFVVCFIAVCICLNRDRRKMRELKKKNKTNRGRNSISSQHPSFSSSSDEESNVVVRPTSMSHFEDERGSGPSLEMDFYDLNLSDNLGERTGKLQDKKSRLQADTSFDS